MHRIQLPVCVYICATLLAATCILGQQHPVHRKPWPTYSLQNMPQTQFTCHDKILGGYYADAETQCQMFHVCVKVAGVGVQDFRFLCPNGTAFDQEAQICADWGDVDCEQSLLYYSSDNFDLYRIGSGFESKRAPLAEEEEATFHLQRAESADIRRSKETRIDQKVSPEQPPNYSRRKFESTTRNSFNNFEHFNGPSRSQPTYSSNFNENNAPKRPIINYYTSSTTTTSTTTERYRDDPKQDFDDIFKGSHSSNFFSNRNGGREDDTYDQYSAKQKPNDFNDYQNRKSETSTTGKTRVPPTPTRPKRIQTSTTSTTITTRPTTPATEKLTKKITLKASYNTDTFDYAQLYKSTVSPPTTASTKAVKRPTESTVHRFNLNSKNADNRNLNYHTHENIQPTTYNPGNGAYRFKATTPKYTELNRFVEKNNNNDNISKSHNKLTSVTRKVQKLDRIQEKLNRQNSTFVNYNEFKEFAKVKPQQPQPFQPVQTTTPPKNLEPQYYRSRNQQQKQQVEQSRLTNQDPAPFSKPQITRAPSLVKTTVKPISQPESNPRGFSNRGSINYKSTTQRNGDSYTATTALGVKKFSTLVPKQQYTPTTFKPTTYKKAYDNYYQTVKPPNKPLKASSTSPTSAPTTANPYYNPDEDDGQYHPELYEIDYPKNRLNLQRGTTTTKKPLPVSNGFQNPHTHLKTQQQSAFQKQQEQSVPVDLSDEEELFKTAHSLNFGAASINKLRADIIKAEKTSQQYNSQYIPKLQETSSPKTTSVPSIATTTFAGSSSAYTTVTTTKKPYEFFAAITTTSRPITSTAVVSHITTKVSKSSGKSTKSSSSKDKKSSSPKTSKRPPHADEDTSYDYAYYDTDTLSEAPQEYEIAEFARTRKN